ncbi:MAG TPA: CusA/CzcA family heavy metal efflux RND transporter [Candidatus Omnitrophota bacterium]|nr:CusA/CzcA family heavy metal efflux RND transporter [Candidatus Omnitrophota bacterium]HPD84282.1 CusA/CzcA family heavy metal efflux RND transporter [Candidatus Omnitrophota bacterium]HRZ03139.1 CusA/CzcA family heavy metal efflux RND transporter [Candidatus Omnitrophota bacterium]
MIEKIIEFSAKNKYIVIIFVIAAMIGAVYSIRNIPLDAIPDLSDTQVIIYSRWDRSPDIIEDQVTYPIVSAMLGAPNVKAIRGFSDFGFSYVYVIYKDGTDIYWARSRTIEYLSKIIPKLPEGVKTEMGPDASSVGWVYQYALVDKTGKNDLAKLRGFQDWYLRYWIQAVPGVAEVASVGGFQKQYQVNVDPNALVSYKIPLPKVVDAIRDSNNDVGGRLVEFSGAEYMIRGRGYAKSVQDIENVAVGVDPSGTPILVKNLAKVALGPDIRRGVADLNGEGDTVGGIVIMRYGENALNVINRVKEKIEEIKPSLPAGVEIVTTYDRSELITRSIETLKHQLIEEMIIVSMVILIFLWHFPSAIIPIVTIPIAILLSFIPMFGMKLTSNIMSLSGIAISIGVLVDGAIVEVENAYKKLQLWEAGGRKGDFHAIRLNALKEVGPSVFFSLLVIAIAFLPVFTLLDQEGRLFKPLAFSKNFAMAIAAILAITLDPAMRMLFTRMDYKHFRPRWLSNLFNTVTVGKYYPEEKHPISKVLFSVYEPACKFVLKYRKATIIGAIILMLSAVPVYMQLGSEFMPPLNEGTILYMPTTLPGISVTETQKLLQSMDKILKDTPEVERVFGKAGRAETSTDPAPFSMMETTVVLKPENQWRKVNRWYSWMPGFLQTPFRPIWRDRITYEDLINDLDQKMTFPGVSNAWTMPIRARIDMLSTGVRTPVGIKIYGADLKEIEKIGLNLESIMKDIKGTRSVFAERVTGGYFIDFDIKREQLARYGLTIKDAETIITSAIGGESVTTTIEGRERYSVNVRYAREFRDDLEKLKRVLVPAMSGAQIPLEELADIHLSLGPAMIRDENGMLAGYVYVDIAGRDVGSYVTEARKIVREKIQLPAGYALSWSGQYENMLRVRERLKIVIPITIFLIFILLYMNTKSPIKASIVMLAVPFSLVGAVWFLHLLHYNMSIAVWVGMIALMGLDAETGVFMLLFLDMSYYDMARQGRMKTREDLHEAIIHGAVKRIRPKMMTVMAMFMGLLPIMWSMGAGADMMKRIAAPMIGGILTSFIMELLVYPPIYSIWKWRYEMKRGTVDISRLPIPELKGY